MIYNTTMSILLLELLVISACLNVPVKAQSPLEINRPLLDAMRQVESGGDVCAIGDNGKSLGSYQIMEGYYNDALQFNPSLADGQRTYDDVWGIGSEPYSEEVISSYMGRYATEQKLGRQPTDEDIARIHNGGPNGYNRDSTLPYWTKVMNEMQRQQMNKRESGTDSRCNPSCLQGQCCSNTGNCSCLSSSFSVQPCTSQSGRSSTLRMCSTTGITFIAFLILYIN